MSSDDREDGASNWHEFTQDVTMHGLRYVHLRKIPRFRRAIWLILILACLGYCGYATSSFLDDYSKRVVRTSVHVQTAEALQFPAVTICNNNLFRLSVVDKMTGGDTTYVMMEILRDLYVNDRPKPPPAEKYNWSLPEIAPITAWNLTDTEEFLRNTAPALDESVFGCTVFSARTNCTDLFTVVPTDGGYCFQFNSDGMQKATNAGKTGGVSFILDAQTYQYGPGPSTYSEGFALAFHEPHEVPLMTELSVGISPGTQATIMLHKAQTNRKPPPADDGRANCFDAATLPNPLHYYEKYSYAGCQAECKTSYVINKCGCRDPFQPDSFVSDEDGLQKCGCRDPCIDSEFTAKVSSYRFPSDNFIAIESIGPDVADYLRTNWVLVTIFYGKMSFQQLDEEFAYTIFDMIANFGGTLGLCVGSSLLTLCEFMEFGLLSAIRRLTSRTQVGAADSQTNNRQITVNPAREERIDVN